MRSSLTSGSRWRDDEDYSRSADLGDLGFFRDVCVCVCFLGYIFWKKVWKKQWQWILDSPSLKLTAKSSHPPQKDPRDRELQPSRISGAFFVGFGEGLHLGSWVELRSVPRRWWWRGRTIRGSIARWGPIGWWCITGRRWTIPRWGRICCTIIRWWCTIARGWGIWITRWSSICWCSIGWWIAVRISWWITRWSISRWCTIGISISLRWRIAWRIRRSTWICHGVRVFSRGLKKVQVRTKLYQVMFCIWFSSGLTCLTNYTKLQPEIYQDHVGLIAAGVSKLQQSENLYHLDLAGHHHCDCSS